MEQDKTIKRERAYRSSDFKRSRAYHSRAFKRAKAYRPRAVKIARAYCLRAIKKILPGAVSILGPYNPNPFNGNLAYARHPPSTSEIKHSKVAEVPSLETNGTNSLDKNFGLDPSSSDNQSLVTREFSYESSLLDNKDEALFKTSVSKTHEANVGIKSSDLFKEDGVDDKLFIKPKSSPPRVRGLSEPILDIFKESAIQKPLSLFEDSDSGEEELLFSSTKLTNLKTKSLRPSPSIHNQNKMVINPGEVLLRTNPPTEKTKQTEAAVNFDKPARIDSILHSAGKDRAKIPIKRRPQSRQARQEALRKDPSEDYVFDDSTLTFPKHSDSSTLEVVVEDFTDSIKKKNDFEATQVSLMPLDNTSNEVTLNNRVVEGIPENLVTSPGTLVLNSNTNPLSPSTDEEDFFGVPQYLPSEYGSNKDLIADSNKDLFGDAPMLSPLDFDDSKSDIVTDLEREIKNDDDDDDENLKSTKTKPRTSPTLVKGLIPAQHEIDSLMEIHSGSKLNECIDHEITKSIVNSTISSFGRESSTSLFGDDTPESDDLFSSFTVPKKKSGEIQTQEKNKLSIFDDYGGEDIFSSPSQFESLAVVSAKHSGNSSFPLDVKSEEAIELRTGETLVKANGLYHSIMNFQFILALDVIVHVIKFTLPLSRQLQSPKIDIGHA
uniref:FAM21/CAPZIP domain-containing protein n=1 Tax=Timema poppense TaxID=170557 RepID=A0A7R9GV26_TIMPO|nr:unnamed protein product [Timema poppensis]